LDSRRLVADYRTILREASRRLKPTVKPAENAARLATLVSPFREVVPKRTARFVHCISLADPNILQHAGVEGEQLTPPAGHRLPMLDTIDAMGDSVRHSRSGRVEQGAYCPQRRAI
jgi:hypothetical protein